MKAKLLKLSGKMRVIDITPEPQCVLEEGAIYSAENGRLVCCECAGMTSKFTGCTRDGLKVVKMTDEDAIEWQDMFNCPLRCEDGCTTYNQIKQIA